MTILATIFRAILYAVTGAFDAAMGRNRKRYERSLVVRAPRNLVWKVVSARQITFDDAVPITIDVAPDPTNPDIVSGTITVGETVMPVAYRELEMRPGEGGVFEFIKAQSDPIAVPGTDYFVAFTVAETPAGTRLTLAHDVTHTRFLSRIGIPLGIWESADRIRRHAEKLAGTAPATSARSPIGDAILTGLLTYGSFMLLMGSHVAAMLIGLILIHELGHALAMRWVGQPVQGIYFVPFLGGLAVAAAPHTSEEERGFVALMGPGLSLLTTAALVAAGRSSGNETLLELAFLSAVLNGMNLAPLLPLDGGHVLDAVTSRFDPEVVLVFKVLLLMAGLGACFYFGLYGMAGIVLLAGHALFTSRNAGQSLPPISAEGQLWLALAYISSLAFYGLAVAAVL